MKLVNISDDYIKYLQNFSKNVKYNKNEKRPYIGIVFEINNHQYFAPLGTPKEKHKHMKSNLDFIKIKNGEMGVINLNNMIPVLSKTILEINKDNYDEQYKKLLIEQERWIIRNKDTLCKNAEKLYTIITTKENTIFHKRCNNYKLLEEKSLLYNRERPTREKRSRLRTKKEPNLK